MTKSYEDSFSDVHLKPTSHSCRSDEALKMAIEFMETLTIDVGIKTWNEKHRKEAIKACKEAYQPVQKETK